MLCRITLMSLVLLLFDSVAEISAQDLPTCAERHQTYGTHVPGLWMENELGCLEGVINDDSYGVLGFSALAATGDGVLYATRPMLGELFAFTDTDDDALPDTPRIIADGLTRPNGLTIHDDMLYISGGNHIYVLDTTDLNAQPEVLVDSVPSDVRGFWTGDVVIGPDDRLYVAAGAPCDFCAFEGERGSVVSYALDGSDRQIIATGLRQPEGIAFMSDALWVVDTARDGLGDGPMLDELNRLADGAHFGFPHCIGADNRPDPEANTLEGTFDCANVTAPALTFPTHSTPFALAAYTSDALPMLRDSLLVASYGPWNDSDLNGIALWAVHFDANGQPSHTDALIPVDLSGNGYTLTELNYRRSGFWPRRPLDVTVDPRGWVYLSITGGQIVALRPHAPDA